MEKYIVELTSEDQKRLSELVCRSKQPAPKITHARVCRENVFVPGWTLLPTEALCKTAIQ